MLPTLAVLPPILPWRQCRPRVGQLASAGELSTISNQSVVAVNIRLVGRYAPVEHFVKPYWTPAQMCRQNTAGSHQTNANRLGH
jgi:hypothetical protein